MSYFGSHRPRLRWFRVALALFTVFGLSASGLIPAALADPGDDGGECSSSFGDGFVVLDEECDDDDGGDDGDDDGDDDGEGSMSGTGSGGGRYRLELIRASCQTSATGTRYFFKARAGRGLRSQTVILRLVDATSGVHILGSQKPAPGRMIELSGNVSKRVGRMGLGFVDSRGRYLKLVTVRCTAA